MLGLAAILSMTVPNAPTATAGSSITTSSFIANWNSVTGADSYKLDVSANNSFSSFVSGYENLTVNSTAQAVSSLSSATSYYYRVRAVNGGGASINSNTITVTTLSSVPDTPTSLGVDNTGIQTLECYWSTSSGATYYEYQYNTNGGSYGSWTSNGSSTNVTITGLTDGDTVCVRVRACNGSGCSLATSSVCVIVGAPT